MYGVQKAVANCLIICFLFDQDNSAIRSKPLDKRSLNKRLVCD